MPGLAFFSANGSVGRLDGPYEGWFDLQTDGTTEDYASERWVNVYDDTGDGTDENAALSILKPVSAGSHTFYLLGARWAGDDTVTVWDSTLTVLVIPEWEQSKVFLPFVVKKK